MNLKGLICDKNSNDLSIGRVMLWICFGILCFHWIKGGLIEKVLEVGKTIPDAPESLVTITIALMGYIIFHKGKDVVKYNIDVKNNTIETEVKNDGY